MYIARSNHYMTLKINNINKTDRESYKVSCKDSKFENIILRTAVKQQKFHHLCLQDAFVLLQALGGNFIFFIAQDVKLRFAVPKKPLNTSLET